jgi:predicted NBD/HSP70 family sugar kinase
VNVAALLDPEVIVLGGGLMNNREEILGPVSERLARAVPYPPRLTVSSLGADAVARGASLLALTMADRLLATRFGRQPGPPEPGRVGALELI